MELNSIDRGEFTEVQATGRLDEHWSDHLSEGLNQVIRDGSHRIRLNMAEVSYVSSSGLRVLIAFYKKLGDIGGSFAVIEPSPMVLKVFDLTRLTAKLVDGVKESPAPAAPTTAAVEPARRIEGPNASYQLVERAEGGFECRIMGDPSLLTTGGYREEHARTATFGPGAVGLGLGAFGSGFADCRDRYGEFLAVAGTAVYLPTDGSSVPDYLVTAEDFVPQVSMLYGLTCEGRFGSLARFEARKESRVVGLGEIAQTALEMAQADSALIVLIAESAGLVGASLRLPPSTPSSGIFAYPEIRRWVSYTAEPAYAGSLCLVVGVASRQAPLVLQPLLRPMGTGLRPSGKISGHFHAAAFPYRPLMKGKIDLPSTVAALLSGDSVQGMLHLLASERESEFVRGACWVGPITKVSEAA